MHCDFQVIHKWEVNKIIHRKFRFIYPLSIGRKMQKSKNISI